MVKAMYRIIITCISAIAIVSNIVAQSLSMTETRIFNSNFKTLQVHPANNEFAPPVIELNSDERLIISFDELKSDRTYLRYRIVHCNADWQPSQLIESEYIDGFNEGIIDDYAFSSATLTNYVNYRIVLPNNDIIFTTSGNYLVQIYPEDDPDDTLLQVRFYVVEPLMNIYGKVSAITDIDARRNHQQLEIMVENTDESIRNWTNDIQLRLTQNSRYDTEKVLSYPNLTEHNRAIYQHDRRLIFPAGNEFRRFEVVSTTYPGLNVSNIEYIHPYYHIDIMDDEPRSDKPYIYDQTQYGHYKVRQSGVNDSDSEADYIITHFSLYMPQQTSGNIYIDGDFTQHNYSPINRMRYNSESGKYEISLMLKMGSYNYQYLFVPDGLKVGQTSKIEGNHYATVNEYFARVYYRPIGSRYDRLVGYTVLYSN